MGVAGPATLKITPPKPYEVVIGQPPALWRPGVISLVDRTRIPIGAVVQAKNWMQTQDGVWATRWGSADYGQPLDGPVTGGVEFTTYDDAGNPTQWVLVMDNGYLRTMKDGAAWTAPTHISTYQFSTTYLTRLVQWNNKVLIANGIDNFSYYDIVLGTLVQYTPLDPPASLSGALNNLSSGTNELYYQVTALNEVGETVGSTTLTEGVNLARNNWYPPNANNISGTSPSITLTWDKVPDAVGYKVYLSDGVAGVTYFLDDVSPTSASTQTFTDYGIDAVNDFIECPTFDTTAAPKFKWVNVSNNQMWACGDPGNLNRLYWGASGVYANAFSPYLGGGWVDVLPGTTQLPTWVGEFRTGQGSPLTTTMLGDPAGYGSTYHVDLESDQIGNSTIVVPNLIKAVGTFGTLSPFGVIETNQNLYFHSGIGGIFSTGSVPTLFNILATNEISILVRPDIKALNLYGLAGLAGIEYDRKLFLTVPYQSPVNNRIMVYDLEKINWNPYAFDFGVKQFIRYTDNSAVTHLLCIPLNGTTLLELNENFTNDNGVAFEAILQTGLHHVSPDHIQFAHTTYAYYDLGYPQGNISMSLSGTPLNGNLQSLVNISDDPSSQVAGVGFSSFAFSARPFSFVAGTLITNTEITVKERMRIFQLLNNWEMTISTFDANAKLTLNQFIIKGEYVPVADPNAWIKN
jgi:hypothetical protein